MQNCFREYPEVYGSELEGDDEAEDIELPQPGQPQSDSTPAPSSKPREPAAPPENAALSGEPASTPSPSAADKAQAPSTSSSKPAASENKLGLVPDNYKPDAKSEEPVSESEELVPKAAHDGR